VRNLPLDCPFERGRVYVRRDIHDQFGGNRRRGIAPSARFPFIFVFTGPTGHKYGYKDEWSGQGTFLYSGEGQIGAMTLESPGNRAILDHSADGKDLILFEDIGGGRVRFIDQMVCVSWEEIESHDLEGSRRSIIRFELIPASPEPQEGTESTWSSSLERLAEAAKQAVLVPEKAASDDPVARESVGKVLVLKRSGGVCEGCGFNAPFDDSTGRPYLEVHDLRRWTDAGPVDPDASFALCPNCHRRAHFGRDREAFNRELQARRTASEAS
jgi:5-methylcytosine-specific restriction protein A